MLTPADEPEQRPLHKRVLATEHSKERAKELRRQLSPPERLLWSRLKSGQLDGLRFRKQHPIGPWIADFYCHAAALVVEVDGWTHRANRDSERDAWMAQRRIGVLRFDAAVVFGNLTGVLALIKKAARERIELLIATPSSPPTTDCSSPAAGGGGVTQAKRV